jgi:hypothetical protein
VIAECLYAPSLQFETNGTGMAARVGTSDTSTHLARVAAAVGVVAVLWMAVVQILGRGPDQVWWELALLVGVGVVLGNVIRRDATCRITCLVAAGLALVWLGMPSGSWGSRALLLGGVLALSAAGWIVICRVSARG